MANIATTIFEQLGVSEFVKVKVEFELELSLDEINEIQDNLYDFWETIMNNEPEPIIKVIKTDRMLK